MLTELPAIVVDVFLSKYVSDNDLRVIHQVSKGWKDLIDQRPTVNERRIQLVKNIREHKENICKTTQPLEIPAVVNQAKSTDNPKPKENSAKTEGSGRVLRELANTMPSTTLSTGSSSDGRRNGRSRKGSSSSRISSTPKSRFQRRYEAGLKLLKGQILFACPDCKSPVPSPVPALKEEKPKANRSLRHASGDSGMERSLSISHISEGSSIQAMRAGLTPSPFDFKSPDSIDISMIGTPYSPNLTPNELQGCLSQNDSGHAYEFQLTKSPTCPFLVASTSSLSIIESLHDSGIESREKLSRAYSSSPLPALGFKQLKLKSSSSPSLLVRDEDVFTQVQNESTTPDDRPIVLQCPDCSYRFCSVCHFREHAGKPCRLINGAVDEEEEEPACSSSFRLRSLSKSSTRPRPRSATSICGKANKKATLRRLCLK